jgi:hypothetical protein
MKVLTCISALLFICCFFGCSSSTDSTEPEVTVQGTVVDGVVMNATYSYKTKTKTITGKSNANGNYKFKLKKGDIDENEPLAFNGGTDKATGLKITYTLKTKIKLKNLKGNVVDNVIASPLTTFLVNSGENEDKVKNSLSLSGVEDPYSFNPFKDSTSESSIKMQKINVQISNIVEALYAGLEGDVDSVMNSFSQTIADMEEGTEINLSDSGFINNVINNVATTVGITISEDVKTELSNLVASVNKEAEDAAATGDFTKMSATQKVVSNSKTTIKTSVNTGNTSSIQNITIKVKESVTTVINNGEINADGFTVVDPGTDIIDEGTGSSGGTDV